MRNSTSNVSSIWIGGPLDGEERSDPRTEVNEIVGRSIICGGSGSGVPAVYQADEQIVENRLYFRFVRFVPPRKRGE
jgi:hypothetical protein